MEDIYDRCQVLILDAEDLEADERAVEIVENYMEEDIDLVLAVGAGTIHDLSRFVAHQYRIPFVSCAHRSQFRRIYFYSSRYDMERCEKGSSSICAAFCFADTDILQKHRRDLPLQVCRIFWENILLWQTGK